jgi:hypothetical protein
VPETHEVNRVSVVRRTFVCRASALHRQVIPFRFVDGIMKAWQRYSTLR